MLSDKAVEAIQQSTRTETIVVPDNAHLTRPAFNPPPEACASPLTVATLDGFAEFVSCALDDEYFDRELYVHVESPSVVALVSGLYGRARQRETYYRAELSLTAFKMGQFYDNETFIIALQSLFVKTDQRDLVLQVVGGIQQNDVATREDDGTTQTVKTRTGISLVKEVKVPNPVELRPFRTFPEIEQPPSLFVLRMRENGDKLPSCALFEADGGAWKLGAVRAIAEYLRGKLPDGLPISA